MDLLNNNDQKIIDRINEEYPPSDENEKEKIFRMTMEKYNRRKNAGGNEETEVTVSGVERYRKFTWTRFAGTVAACLAIIAGTAATVHLTRNGNGVPDISQTSQVVTTISGTNAAGKENNTVSTVAVSAETYAVPFGKMADYDYQLCGESENGELPQMPLVIRFGDDKASVFTITDTLSDEKRSALDGFFSTQKWQELSEGKMISDNSEQENGKALFIFAAKTGNSVRIIRINNDNTLFFNEIPCTENGGILYTDVDNINKKGENYKIDSALFKSSIEAILNGSAVPAPTEANTEPTTEPASSAAADTTEAPEPQSSDAEHIVTVDTYRGQTYAPFGNFNDMDFRFASASEGNPIADAANTLTEPDRKTRIVFELTSSTEYHDFAWDTPLSYEQKKKVADIFNNYTWNAISEPITNGASDDADSFSMMCMDDPFIYEITFTDNNYMRFDTYVTEAIVGNDDYIAYKAASTYYSVDYTYFRDAIADAVVSPYQYDEHTVYFTLTSDDTNRSYDIICIYTRGDKVSLERFDPFYDIPGTISKEYGIGLEFVRNIPDIQKAQICIVNKSNMNRAVIAEYTYDPGSGSVTTVFEEPQAAYSAVQ